MNFGKAPEKNSNGKLFRLLRFYALASLAAMLIAAVLFVFFIHKVAIKDLIELSERNNLTITQTVLNGVRPELLRFLATVKDLSPGEPVEVKPPEEFTSAIEHVLRDTAVVRIKLYNRLGTVVFATEHEKVGEDQEENGGFKSAIKGKVTSVLIYRGTFNRFDKVTEDDNLISTYIPIRSSIDEAPPGVFEVYTDASSLVSRNERTEFVILLGVALILGFLYAMLLLIVNRAANVIDAQQETIRERTATLEMLSAHLLTLEERDKKRIAVELHEGLAQTLCTLKMALTASLGDLPKRGRAVGAVESVIPALQSAIEEVQDIAQGLRPSSLDTLGLLPTIDYFLRNFERTNPGIRVEHAISLQEENVPTPLKVVIFRVIEAAFRIVATEANTDRIQLDLHRRDEEIVLEIIDNLPYSARTALMPTVGSNLKRRFAKIHEQTILSGGSFSVDWNAADGIAISAAWPSVASETNFEPASAGASMATAASTSADEG